MLDYAVNYSDEEINKIIVQHNYPYLSFSCYRDLAPITFTDSEWEKIQRVSVDEEGNLLGYLGATPNYHQERVDGLFLAKFSKLKHFNYDIFKKDLEDFIESLVKDSRFRLVSFKAIVDNPANRTYEKWLDKYGGYRHKFDNYFKLMDNKYHGYYQYVIDKS